MFCFKKISLIFLRKRYNLEIARVLLFQHHFCPCLLVGEFVEILFGVETEEKHLLMSPAFLTVRNAVEETNLCALVFLLDLCQTLLRPDQMLRAIV